MPYATPFMSTSLYSLLSPKRKESDPIFGLLHLQPSGGHGTAALTLSGHKLAISASMPNIAFYCLKKRSRDTAYALHSQDVSAPCVCISKPEVKMPLPSKESLQKEPSWPIQRIWCFEELGKNIRDFPSRISCLKESLTTKPYYISLKNMGPLKKAGHRTPWISRQVWDGASLLDLHYTML